jgi:hypothetical protein
MFWKTTSRRFSRTDLVDLREPGVVSSATASSIDTPILSA